MAAIFLDLDGTLVDPKPGITGSVIHALRALGLDAPTPDALEWVIGPALIDSFARLGVPDPTAALELYRAHYRGGAMYDCTVYPGIPAALQALTAAGHQLFLATAKPHEYARQITARFGLAPFFQAEFGPELDGTRNDKGDLLAHALDQTGLDAATSVMVGDRSHDRNAAAHVGMRFVGVKWGYGSAEELTGAIATCDAPGDLPAAIG